MGLANKLNFPLVPSGGRTGLSGGALAKDRELVVSFDLMNKILGFNKTDALVTCQPGVVTRVLKDFAESKGLFYPVDFCLSRFKSGWWKCRYECRRGECTSIRND